MNIYTTTVTLILVMDPLGNIPIFLSLLQHLSPRKRMQVILREMLIAFGILTLFLFFGKYILYSLSLTEASVRAAGGIILFLIAIKMIFPSEHAHEEYPGSEPLLVPLAIPLIAGPSAMATVLLFATQYPHEQSLTFLALLMASIISTFILLSGNRLRHWLGKKGLIAMERLMGMILTTIAVQMFFSGVTAYWHP